MDLRDDCDKNNRSFTFRIATVHLFIIFFKPFNGIVIKSRWLVV